MLLHKRLPACDGPGPTPGLPRCGNAAVIIGTLQTRAPPAASFLRKLRLDSPRAARDSGSIFRPSLPRWGGWLSLGGLVGTPPDPSV